MDSDDILDSHFESAFPEMIHIITDLDVEGVKVVSVTKDETGCKEIYPCSHFDSSLYVNDDRCYNVDSVTAGYVQYFYFPKKETHFTPYCSKYARSQIDILRRGLRKN